MPRRTSGMELAIMPEARIWWGVSADGGEVGMVNVVLCLWFLVF